MLLLFPIGAGFGYYNGNYSSEVGPDVPVGVPSDNYISGFLQNTPISSGFVDGGTDNGFSREIYGFTSEIPFSDNPVYFKAAGIGIAPNYSEIIKNITASGTLNFDKEWFTPQISMIIIVRDTEAAAVKPLADWKTLKGVPTVIINSTVWSKYEGRDDAEKIRNCIKSYYVKYGIKWVLLAGDVKDDTGKEMIPTRYVKNPDSVIVGMSEAYGDPVFKPTDYYYSDLNGSWDTDNDSVFGESLLYTDKDEIEWYPDVNVGRFPGKNSYEISLMVNKTLKYEKDPYIGDWMGRVLLASAVQQWWSDSDRDGEEEIHLANRIIHDSIEGRMQYIHLTQTIFMGYNLTRNGFRDRIGQGNSIVFWAGHGSPTSYIGIFSSIPTTYLDTTDVGALTNTNMPSLFYGDACSTGMLDYYTDSIGEALIKHPTGGAIGYIGGYRLTWFYQNDSYGNDPDLQLCELNRGMARLFFEKLLNEGYYKQGEALSEMKRAYLNSKWLQNNPEWGYDNYNIHNIEWERKNVMTYNLYGDPETDIYTAIPSEFDSQSLLAGNYSEGKKLILTIKDTEGRPVPYARICIRGDNGAYGTFTSDAGGNIVIRLPRGVSEYNYTVTGHNMRVFYGNFTTYPDNTAPEVIGTPIFEPSQPSVDYPITVRIKASDRGSGVYMGFLVLSDNDFTTYRIYPMEPSEKYPGYLVGTIGKPLPGKYVYTIIVADYAGNIYYPSMSDNNSFTVPVPLIAVIAVLITVITAVSTVTAGTADLRKILSESRPLPQSLSEDEHRG